MKVFGLLIGSARAVGPVDRTNSNVTSKIPANNFHFVSMKTSKKE
jgi:hypothetical protein